MAEKTNTPVVIKNATRDQLLACRVKVAGDFWTRLKGLIGSAPLEEGEGLLILPSNSVHTHFMSFPIDVLYIDKTQVVVAMNKDMKPWRMSGIHRNARCVLELPAGTLEVSQTQVGDQLVITGISI
jgi:uncharacterized membrane protein (UPF0127 family)